MSDIEVELTLGSWKMRSSTFGASLRGVFLNENEIVTGYSGKTNKAGGQGDVLIPFPGRIAGGTFAWEGVSQLLGKNDKDGPNAIHGFLRLLEWDCTAQNGESVQYEIDFDGVDGYPFPLHAFVKYFLDGQGFTCEVGISNRGKQSAPVAVGFHPYFTVGTDLINHAKLTLPFESVLEMKDLIPTGEILPCADLGFDFREGREIGETKLNDCFLNPSPDADGLTRIKLEGPLRSTTLWMDSSFPYVVLYSGDPMPEPHRRRSLAIEPMTCAADAFNHEDWGVKRLSQGETFTGSWGVTSS